MRFPKFKLSTLIVLNLIAAAFLWLNVKELVLAPSNYIAPLGWPNDAVLLYQEEWHKIRAERGFIATWGEVMPARLAGNAVLFFSIVALAGVVLERKSIGWVRPARNTWWMLAAVASIFVALNVVKHSNALLEGPGYGFPFLTYSWEKMMVDFLSDEQSEFNTGWHLPNLVANICVATWMLLGTYALCQKLFMKQMKGVPAAVPASS